MEASQIRRLVEQHLKNTITESDRQVLMKLVRSGEAEELLKDKIEETLIAEKQVNAAPTGHERDRFERIFETIIQKKRPVVQKTFPNVYRYAASLIVIGIAAALLYLPSGKDTPRPKPLAVAANESVTIKNNESNTKRIDLPDGSVVLLEPGSEVRYQSKFKEAREIFLSGEAFFDVTKDAAHPFLVFANEVTTKVLGTSFRVKANKGGKEIIVAVKTGKVSVFAKSVDGDLQNSGTREITLTPNQQAIYKRTEHVVLKKIVERPEVIIEQTALKSSYVNEQVVAILDALGKSYGVNIRYDAAALSGCTLTSDVIESEGLYDQLDIICSALGGSYTQEDDASLVIQANGCSK